MITIYHNPRCRKSREGLEVLEKSGMDYKLVRYLDDPLKVHELENLLESLQLTPIELIRKNEPVWKEKYQGKNLTDQELIMAMAEHPKLIERPVVVKGQKAVIGRPAERIAELLQA